MQMSPGPTPFVGGQALRGRPFVLIRDGPQKHDALGQIDLRPPNKEIGGLYDRADAFSFMGPNRVYNFIAIVEESQNVCEQAEVQPSLEKGLF